MYPETISVWFQLAPVFSEIVIIGNRTGSFAFLSRNGAGINSDVYSSNDDILVLDNVSLFIVQSNGSEKKQGQGCSSLKTP